MGETREEEEAIPATQSTVLNDRGQHDTQQSSERAGGGVEDGWVLLPFLNMRKVGQW